MLRLKPGSISEANVLFSVCVCQPVCPGCLACSKLYDRELVLMLSRRILRAVRPVVSPGGGLSLASKFCDNPRLMVCCGSLNALKLRPLGSTAWANSADTCVPGA